MAEKYRVGVIGAGLKGTQHARAYQLDPRAEVTAVAEKDPEALELFQKRFGLERGYTDYREMLANEQVDIAAPILPSTVIPEVVLASVEADVKGIFCEKPMCVTLDEAERLFHPALDFFVHETIRSADIGQVVSSSSSFILQIMRVTRFIGTSSARAEMTGRRLS